MKEFLIAAQHNDKIKDGGVLGMSGSYFITSLSNLSVSNLIGYLTLLTILLRLIEIFVGKPIADIIWRKNKKPQKQKKEENE